MPDYSELTCFMRSSTPIAILLSTYNGEKYLSEQLDSIIGQTSDQWSLYIRDDGSSDCTLDIIKSYGLKYPEKIHVVFDKLGNLGSGKSFMTLLSYVDADYYMFCDQDDVWLSDKIERLFRKIRQKESLQNNCPVCVFSDLQIVDSDLRSVSPSLWKYSGIDPDNCRNVYDMIVFGCPAFGCAMIFNRLARQHLLPYPGWKYHDLWTVLVISGVGLVDYIPTTTILYRQHGLNVTGAHRKIDRIHYIRSIKNIGHTIYDQYLKLASFKQLPFSISSVRIVWLKTKKCIKTLLFKASLHEA